jgi:hypothetical protein
VHHGAEALDLAEVHIKDACSGPNVLFDRMKSGSDTSATLEVGMAATMDTKLSELRAASGTTSPQVMSGDWK